MKITKNNINNIAKKHEKSDIYVGSNIPRKKEKNFRNSNDFITDGDTILILIDLTIFGSAKNAIAITEDGLFWSDNSNEKLSEFFLEWDFIFKSELTITDKHTLQFIKFDNDYYTINLENSESSRNEILGLFHNLQTLQNNIDSDDIYKIAKKHERSDIYVGNNIPRKKEKNFRNSNSFITDSDTILILIDLTIFGSAKNAIAITEEGLFWSDNSNEKLSEFFLEWDFIFKSELTITDKHTLLFIKFDNNDYTINLENSESSRNEILGLLHNLQTLQNNIDSDDIYKIAKKHERSDIYVGSNIPRKKEKNFRNSNDFITDSDTILILIDLTFFGSAKNAIAITEDDLFWSDDINEKYDILMWSEFSQAEITLDENKLLFIECEDETYIINIENSHSPETEILNLLLDLQTLQNNTDDKEIIDTENKKEPLKPDVKVSSVLEKPYEYLEMFITKILIQSSPAYALTLYHITDEEFDRDELKRVSDKHQMEKEIITAENNYVNVFKGGISTYREDLHKIMQSDMGNIFTYNNEVLSSLEQEMMKYRNILIPKMSELYGACSQLNQYWVQSQESTTGDGINKFIKGGSIGLIASSVFGPFGLVAAMGATYLNEKNDEDKKDAQENLLLEHWDNTYNSFYQIQLKEYYTAYLQLSQKIAKQFVENHKLAYAYAKEKNKENDFKTYMKAELKELATNEEFIEIRSEADGLAEIMRS